MVDFPFIVSLYVSDLPNVTISSRSSRGHATVAGPPRRLLVQYSLLVLTNKFKPFILYLVRFCSSKSCNNKFKPHEAYSTSTVRLYEYPVSVPYRTYGT